MDTLFNNKTLLNMFSILSLFIYFASAKDSTNVTFNLYNSKLYNSNFLLKNRFEFGLRGGWNFPQFLRKESDESLPTLKGFTLGGTIESFRIYPSVFGIEINYCKNDIGIGSPFNQIQFPINYKYYFYRNSLAHGEMFGKIGFIYNHCFNNNTGIIDSDQFGFSLGTGYDYLILIDLNANLFVNTLLQNAYNQIPGFDYRNNQIQIRFGFKIPASFFVLNH